MSREADSSQQGAPAATPARIIAASLRDKHVCPFCGTIRETPDGKCPRCTLEDAPAVRQAIKARIGPWQVFQPRNPTAPGMRFPTLLAYVQKGQVTARSIVRGPTTHQLWRFAARIKGLSREFGVCYGCGGDLNRSDRFCPHCQRVQDPPGDPDALLESWSSAAAATVRAGGESGQNTIPDTGRSADLVIPVISGPGSSTAANDTGSARPREFIPPRVAPAPRVPARIPAQAESPPPRPAPADAILDPAQLAETFSIRLEPRGPQKMARSAGLFFLMTLVGVATWLLIDRDTWRLVANWFSDSVSSVRGNWRDTPVTTPQPGPAPIAPKATPPGTPATPPPSPAMHRDPPETMIDPPDRAIEQARRLWREALDCEARNDWAGAVAKYEAIKKLPPMAWPGAVDTYLSRARERLR